MTYRVLILCTGNSARSQMAEGLINRVRGEQWQALSAGTHPTGRVHPKAVAVLAERDIEISGARSKSVDEFRNEDFDLVITVCDEAAEECPVWLGPGKRVHVSFPDPARGSLDDFRAVRDGILSCHLSLYIEPGVASHTGPPVVSRGGPAIVTHTEPSRCHPR